jgi:hypothetical protein
MDCLEARSFLHQQDAASERDRDAALEHLDGCAECGAIAPSLDPLLLFRRLPELQVSTGDTARMREAVSVLRRAPVEPAPKRAALGLRLAAALVAAGGLWLAPGPSPVGVGGPGPSPVGVGGAGPFDGTPDGSSPAPAALVGAVPAPEYMPSVETISDAYVATQITEDDLTLVILANVDVAGQ